ncbi:unnamed protein product [Lota lota]
MVVVWCTVVVEVVVVVMVEVVVAVMVEVVVAVEVEVAVEVVVEVEAVVEEVVVEVVVVVVEEVVEVEVEVVVVVELCNKEQQKGVLQPHLTATLSRILPSTRANNKYKFLASKTFLHLRPCVFWSQTPSV